MRVTGGQEYESPLLGGLLGSRHGSLQEAGAGALNLLSDLLRRRRGHRRRVDVALACNRQAVVTKVRPN